MERPVQTVSYRQYWELVALTDAGEALKYSRGLSNMAFTAGLTSESLTAVKVHRAVLKSAHVHKQNSLQSQSQLK